MCDHIQIVRPSHSLGDLEIKLELFSNQEGGGISLAVDIVGDLYVVIFPKEIDPIVGQSEPPALWRIPNFQ